MASFQQPRHSRQQQPLQPQPRQDECEKPNAPQASETPGTLTEAVALARDRVAEVREFVAERRLRRPIVTSGGRKP